MAYRRSYRSNRGYSRARRTFRSSRFKAKSGFGNFQMRWLAGAAGGVLLPRIHPMQDMVMTAIAVAPVQLPSGIKSIAQGYVGGTLLRPFMGSFGVSGVSGGDSSGITYG